MAAVYNKIDYDGRVQREAEALSGRFDVTVFSIDSGKGYKNPYFSSYAVPLPDLRHFKGIIHLLFWTRFWLHAIWARPSVVHAHDFFMAFPGWLAARLTGARFVYDAHELIIPEDGIPQSGRDRFFYMLEKWTVRRADLVIAANRERAELMQAHYGLPRLPVVVGNIPRMPEEASGMEEAATLHPLLQTKGAGKCRLVYQGDISLARGVGEFVQAMKYLDERFELFMVGDGPDMEELQRQAQGLGGGDRIVFLGKVPNARLHGILKRCDIGLISYATKGSNNVYCASNKIFEYAQAGLPVITTDQPPLRAVVDTYGLGLVVAGGHPAKGDLRTAIKEAALEINADMEKYVSSIPRFLRENRWENEAARLAAAVQDLIGPGGRRG